MLVQTFLLFFLFMLLSLISFYVPGALIINKVSQNLEDSEIITLSFVLGISIFVSLAILLGFIQLRFLCLPIILAVNFFTVWKLRFKPLVPFKIFIKNRFLSFLVILAILIQGLINFPSGYLFKGGLLFWSAQGHDGIWHVALMEEIKKEFPPKSPIYAGEALYNYHYLVDVLGGEFGRIFPFFTSLDLYFRFFPVIFSFLISFSVFSFVRRWTSKEAIGYLAIFYTTFTGSFGWIVNVLRGKGPLGGETVFWAAQSNTIIGNPPHAISFSILCTFLLSFYFTIKERSNWWFAISFLLAYLLAGFKVSSAMVLLIGLGIASLIDLIFYKRKKVFLLTLILGLANAVTIKLLTRSAQSFLVFAPWWFIRTLIVAPDRLNWIDLELKREFYLSLHSTRGYLRVIEYETIAFFLFLFGNIGTRFVGFYSLFKETITGWRQFFRDPLGSVILFAMLAGFVIPLLFIQNGITYNNIQFLQYFNLLLGFFAAITTYKIIKFIKSAKARVIFMAAIILLSIPTVLGNIVEFYGPNTAPNAKISNQEIQALNYLKENSSSGSVVLNAPFNKYNGDANIHPAPIFAWYSTAYIAALSARPTYLSDEEQAFITGYPMQSRLEKEKKFFIQRDPKYNKSFLRDERISFIYAPKIEVKQPFNEQELGIKKVFENNEVRIYKVL